MFESEKSGDSPEELPKKKSSDSVEPISFQLLAVRLTITVGLLVGMAISWKLWYSADRVFPRLPVSSFPQLASGLELALLIGLIVFLAGMFFAKRLHAFCCVSAIILLCLLAAGDQMRWQPWVYQYLLMLLPFVWLRAKHPSQIRASGALILKAQRLIIIAIYFWAGYHKFGPDFQMVWLEDMVASLIKHLEVGGKMHGLVTGAWKYVPWMEIMIAVMLIFSRTRWIGIVMACLMHVGILVLLGPWMAGMNEVIWPWNLCMMVFVIVLFRPKKTEKLTMAWHFAKNGSRVTLALIVVLVGIMPFFSKSRQWDRYLSFHLYSGGTHRYSLILLPAGLKKLPAKYRPYLFDEAAKVGELNISYWSDKELKVPPVSEDRVMLAWCKIMTGFDFTDRDCFIHHDLIQNEKAGVNRHKPSEVREMIKIPPLPGVKIGP